MRILFICGREIEYERNEVLLRSFLRLTPNVKTIASKGKPASLLANSLQIACRALWHLGGSSNYDLIFVGFYGYMIARILAPLTSTPLLLDAFISNFDTLCNDRKVWSPNSFAGKYARWLDRSTCQSAQTVLLDTVEHKKYFVHTFGIEPSKLFAIPVGCNEEIFVHRPSRFGKNDQTIVLYYCTYQPLHGADIVVRAAAEVEDLPITFRLVGEGPQYRDVRQRARSLSLNNVTFLPSVSRQQLAVEIENAHICLGGHFGSSNKASRVVPGKVYQILSIGRPLIAADSPANRRLLQHGDNALLVSPQSHEQLAAATRLLHEQPLLARKLAEAGHRRYRAVASEGSITQQLELAVQHCLATDRGN